VCAEIGVWNGTFSARILTVVQPSRLHLIDPWAYPQDPLYRHSLYGNNAESQKTMDTRYQRVATKFRNEILSNKVIIVRMPSQKAAAVFPDNYFDWIYIDGNHLYDHVMEDLCLYYPKVKHDGAIAGDDYDFHGWWNDGVTRAVDEFSNRYPVVKAVMGEHQFILRKQSRV
jgi:hypothetical protein